MIGYDERFTKDNEKGTIMNSEHEKKHDEHRETVVTGQIEKRSASTAHHTSVLPRVRRGRVRTGSASTAHHTSVLPGDRGSPIPLSISTDHYTSSVIGRPQEIKKGRGNQSRDISDDNNTVQSSDKTHDEKSEQ